MNSKRSILPALLSATMIAVLAGCSSGVKLNDTPVESKDVGTGGAGANTGARPESQVAPVDLTKNANANVVRVIYFDFDSYAVKDEFRPAIESYAKLLTANRAKHVAIEGHTDARGGSEYNLALGQKRAEAVAKSMTLLGVADSQVEAVSFGKERPAVQGNDEAAYAKNRRAELVDR